MRVRVAGIVEGLRRPALGLLMIVGIVAHRTSYVSPALPCTDDGVVARARGAPVAPELVLQLNVPAFRLEIRERGAVARVMRVAVGQPRYPTPRGTFAVDYVVWNPWWRPPDAAWARQERPVPPGWANPVGRVKLHVTGLVFMHGTPAEGSLGTAASHACIRLANRDAIALARLVHAHVSPDIAVATLDSLEADTAATREIPLQARVPIEIRYDLAEVLGDDLVLYPDIYHLAGRSIPTVAASAIAALARAGRDTSQLRQPVLRGMARRARDRVTSLPLDSLAPAMGGPNGTSVPPLAARPRREGVNGMLRDVTREPVDGELRDVV